jgi:hypothetical protein
MKMMVIMHFDEDDGAGETMMAVVNITVAIRMSVCCPHPSTLPYLTFV